MSVYPADLLWRCGLFGILWLILCGGELRSWPFGLPTVLLATWLSFALSGGQVRRLSLLRLGRYIPFFAVKSLASGVDVMLRVLHPRLPIDPALIEFPLTIEHGSGRIFLANSVTLLPGTITARLVDDHLIVHTLDKGLPVLATIQELERRIAVLYVTCPSQGPGRGLL